MTSDGRTGGRADEPKAGQRDRAPGRSRPVDVDCSAHLARAAAIARCVTSRGPEQDSGRFALLGFERSREALERSAAAGDVD